MDRLIPSNRRLIHYGNSSMDFCCYDDCPDLWIYVDRSFCAPVRIYIDNDGNLCDGEHSVQLTREERNLIYNLFLYAVGTANYVLLEEEVDGFDGTTYIITVNGHSAECWSPEGELCKRLADVIDCLIRALYHERHDEIKEKMTEIANLGMEFAKIYNM